MSDWPLLAIVAFTVVLTMVGVLFTLNVVGGEKKVQRRVRRLYDIEDQQFARELSVLLGPPFVGGNRFTTLVNGDRIFPAMLEALRAAQRTITFETFIYWSGDIGRQFAEALAERARAGVRVHVLLDWVGSLKMEPALLQTMEEGGVQVRRFHAPHWSRLGRLNNRTHRKMLVVDGRIGFTGGVGIAPPWCGDAQDPEHWRDTHFRVEGPVVAQMQAVFLDNWIKVRGEVLHGGDYFPALEPVGDMHAQVFSSSPTGGSESMQLMYLMAITAAARTIDLAASYFVPGKLVVEALVAALKRGVKLRIVVPGEHIDSDITRNASRAGWGPLLEAGALIAEYQPTMFHCKVMIVDGLLVATGSTNFDERSFRLNDEATLNVMDPRFARELTALFEADLAKARPISHAQWLARPWHEKLRERAASLVASQL
jgi:cardiolipin synthase